MATAHVMFLYDITVKELVILIIAHLGRLLYNLYGLVWTNYRKKIVEWPLSEPRSKTCNWYLKELESSS